MYEVGDKKEENERTRRNILERFSILSNKDSRGELSTPERIELSSLTQQITKLGPEEQQKSQSIQIESSSIGETIEDRQSTESSKGIESEESRPSPTISVDNKGVSNVVKPNAIQLPQRSDKPFGEVIQYILEHNLNLGDIPPMAVETISPKVMGKIKLGLATAIFEGKKTEAQALLYLQFKLGFNPQTASRILMECYSLINELKATKEAEKK